MRLQDQALTSAYVIASDHRQTLSKQHPHHTEHSLSIQNTPLDAYLLNTITTAKINKNKPTCRLKFTRLIRQT